MSANQNEAARYVYCIVEGRERASLGNIGVDALEVYTIASGDISAVVHDCPAKPYASDDPEVVKQWVLAHQKVVDAAWERFGTVLPLAFDTMIKGEGDRGPDENVVKWLESERAELRSKFERVRGKAEYGVQVLWDPKVVAEEIVRRNQEIRKIDEEIRTKPKGAAYMYKQKLEKALKLALEREADESFKDFYKRISTVVDEARVEKTKKVENSKQMVMNLSCLACKEKAAALGKVLDEINAREGIFVRFTGPWPPYSFVAAG